MGGKVPHILGEEEHKQKEKVNSKYIAVLRFVVLTLWGIHHLRPLKLRELLHLVLSGRIRRLSPIHLFLLLSTGGDYSNAVVVPMEDTDQHHGSAYL